MSTEGSLNRQTWRSCVLLSEHRDLCTGKSSRFGTESIPCVQCDFRYEQRGLLFAARAIACGCDSTRVELMS